ncbi:hypothetical protein OVA07_16435 [Novosphingobium sp. SL115]|uniref:ImuA family protein n=1 Tax=Novosphingobium sp. SL115 TaxID=2995150 RepID=UPI00227336B6|nr:hypothetical protein [Novosphingobium sp. SL115]MCY1672589.1 hypothetical protein [Novosphingobium sp. SL115]
MRESAEPLEACRCPFGIASLDAALGGGLARGRVHEFYATEGDDAASAAGFVVSVATGMTASGGTVLWLRAQRAARMSGVLQAHGWTELGGTPGRELVGVMPDSMSLLRAAVDALRCAALGAVIMEGWGVMRELDLTASRRLALAAEKSGVPLLLLRHEATPVPSAAQTRWRVAAAPSHALPGNAPGGPTFDVTLLRQRSGPCGLDWRLEWDRDRRMFREAALSGAVVSPPAHRPAADSGGDDRWAA